MASSASSWMIYGATGYTGELIARAAVARGERPILAGRSLQKLRPLAESLGLEQRAFALDDDAALTRGIDGVKAVLHCAGPFIETAAPMRRACLRAGIHYLDIAAEIEVFEASFAADAEARAAGVAVISGVGFDVVPADCLAVLLARALPGARRLQIAMAGLEVPSAGSVKSLLEMLARGCAVRRGGKLEWRPLGSLQRQVPFADGTRRCSSVPTADVITAWHSTGIPDIEVYAAATPAIGMLLRGIRMLGPVLAKPRVQELLAKPVERLVHGPTEEQRRTLRVQLWGRVEDAAGRAVEGTLETIEPYALTAEAALACVRGVMEGVEPGARTPAQAFGPELITRIDGNVLRVPAEPGAHAA